MFTFQRYSQTVCSFFAFKKWQEWVLWSSVQQAGDSTYVSNIAVVLSTLHILIVGTVYFYAVENFFGSDHTWAVS